MAAKELKFDTNGTARKPFLIGVAGGTASGKSSVCKRIVELLGQNDTQNDANRRVAIVSQDSYYRELSAEEQQAAEMGNFNFDHPRAFDEKKMVEALKKIVNGKRVQVPVYDYVKNCITPDKYLNIDSVDVVLVEGILTFYFSEIRELFDLKLFVDTDADTRLSRRVIRDTKEYGRDLDQTLYQYVNYVKPAFEEFCLPTKKYADVIIPRGIDNRVAIDLIVQHIRELQKTTEKTRSPPVRVNSTPSDLLNYDDDDYSGRRPGVRPH